MKTWTALGIVLVMAVCGACSPGLRDLPNGGGDPGQRIARATRALRQMGLSGPERSAAYASRCWGYNEAGDLDKALSDCNRAVSLDPENEWAYINRAYTHNESARYEMAVVDCNAALMLNPNNPVAYVNRGFSWNHLGEFDHALADSEAALAMDPNNAAALINRGHAWYEKGDYARALRDCEAAVKADPGYTLAFNSLAYLLATCPDPAIRDGDRAVRLARTALEMEPENSMIWDTLAMSLAEAGRYAEAVEAQEKALEILDARGTPKERKRRASYVEHLEMLKGKLRRGSGG